MKDVPRLKIEISGHTDNQGSEKLNMKLSKGRAASVREWLIGKGVSSARMTSAGYGPNQPMADNNTSDGRQQNRRTEFRLL